MTQQQIYHLNEQGELEPMREEPFALEDDLQELVAGHLELLSGERINPDKPRRFILIDRGSRASPTSLAAVFVGLSTTCSSTRTPFPPW